MWEGGFPLKWPFKIHHLHRCWRYRLRTEKDSLSWLLALDLAGKVVVDAGANRGVYSYWMSKAVGPSGKTIAFEPQQECVDHLKRVKTKFRLRNLVIVPKGLSSYVGTATMARDKPKSVGASLEWVGNRPDGEYEHLQVEVDTLDAYFSNSRPPSLIKCDVEGHELSVFQGGQELLSRSHPDLLFECHRKEAIQGALFSFLENLGYSGFFFEKGERHPADDFDKVPFSKPSLAFRNYIFQFDKTAKG